MVGEGGTLNTTSFLVKQLSASALHLPMGQVRLLLPLTAQALPGPPDGHGTEARLSCTRPFQCRRQATGRTWTTSAFASSTFSGAG